MSGPSSADAVATGVGDGGVGSGRGGGDVGGAGSDGAAGDGEGCGLAASGWPDADDAEVVWAGRPSFAAGNTLGGVVKGSDVGADSAMTADRSVAGSEGRWDGSTVGLGVGDGLAASVLGVVSGVGEVVTGAGTSSEPFMAVGGSPTTGCTSSTSPVVATTSPTAVSSSPINRTGSVIP